MSNVQSRFDVSDPMVITRILCGLFYFPHAISKIIGFSGAVGFFSKAGLTPPEAFVVLSITMELVCGIGLTFGLFTKYVGIISAGVMAVAAYATVAVHGLGWYWAGHGIEYLVFWAIASLAVALDAWKRNPSVFGLFELPLNHTKAVAA